MSFLNSSVSLAAILQRCILVATAIAFLPLAAFAKAIVVPSLPVSQYADTEVATNIAFNTIRSDVKTFELNFQLECSSSNCIQVAFGRDADCDGMLSFTETDVVYGWRNGRYFVEDVKGACRYEETASSSLGNAHNFYISIRTAEECRPKEFSARADSALLFADLAEGVPEWLYRPEWNLMRITRRGVGLPLQWVSYDVKYAQLYITVR